MPNNQNPVFTDNATVFGDGTVEDPLTTSSSASGLSNAAFGNQQSPPGTPVTIATGTLGVDILDLTFNIPPGTWNVLLFGSLQINNSASDIDAILQIQNLPSTKGSAEGTTPSTGAQSLALSCLGLDASVTGPVSKTYHLVAGNNGAADFDYTWGTLFALLVPA